MDVLNVIIAAISGGLLTQFVNAKINAKKGSAEIDTMKHDLEKKISAYYKDEIDYLTKQMNKYKVSYEDLTRQLEDYKGKVVGLTAQVGALMREIKQLQSKQNKNNGTQRKINK